MSEDVIGSPEHKPFAIYARGERWPLESVIEVDGGSVVYRCLRWAPVDRAGNVTLSAEALRDLCNHVGGSATPHPRSPPHDPPRLRHTGMCALSAHSARGQAKPRSDDPSPRPSPRMPRPQGLRACQAEGCKEEPMTLSLSATWDRNGIAVLAAGPMRRSILKALRKAGATALRDMRSEASKRVRKRKRIPLRFIRRAITLRRATGSDVSRMTWAVDVAGDPVPLVAYPHRQTAKGVSVEVNRGKRTLVKGAFVAKMRSGHEGVFRRRGPQRLPIDELLGSRPVDALLHEGEAEAVAERGGKSFAATFARVLPMEIGK